MKRILIALIVLAASPSLAQNPDPAWALSRPRPIDAPVTVGERCYYMGYRGYEWQRCVRALAEAPRRRAPVALPGLMCDTVRMDADYSFTDCF